MSVLAIFEFDVQDETQFQDYLDRRSRTLRKSGGAVLVDGRAAVAVEGGKPEYLLDVLRFPSRERYLEWVQSEEYQPLKAIRDSSARTRVSLAPAGEPHGGSLRRISTGAVAYSRAATGALAIGAFALGAFAVGALAIGSLAVNRAAIRKLRIGELTVDRLDIMGRREA
jgi:uncharacterized protein (DUF1330 family)